MFSFTARKKAVEYQRYIRRMIDLTIPNKSNSASTERFQNRHNRAIPVLLCPWARGGPVLSECLIAITKDISDQGIGLILNAPFAAKDVVLGFCLGEEAAAEPWFFRGAAEHNLAIGGGYWLLGIALKDFMNQEYQVELAPLVPMSRKLQAPPRS